MPSFRSVPVRPSDSWYFAIGVLDTDGLRCAPLACCTGTATAHRFTPPIFSLRSPDHLHLQGHGTTKLYRWGSFDSKWGFSNADWLFARPNSSKSSTALSALSEHSPVSCWHFCCGKSRARTHFALGVWHWITWNMDGSVDLRRVAQKGWCEEQVRLRQ